MRFLTGYIVIPLLIWGLWAPVATIAEDSSQARTIADCFEFEVLGALNDHQRWISLARDLLAVQLWETISPEKSAQAETILERSGFFDDRDAPDR